MTGLNQHRFKIGDRVRIRWYNNEHYEGRVVALNTYIGIPWVSILVPGRCKNKCAKESDTVKIDDHG